MKKFALIAVALCMGLSGLAQQNGKSCPGNGADKACSQTSTCKPKACGKKSCCGKSCSGKSLDAKEAWATLYPEIEKNIKAPTFRDKDYKIFDYGKKSKTKGFLYTELINLNNS